MLRHKGWLTYSGGTERPDRFYAKCGSCSLALLDLFQFSFPGFYFAGNFPHFGKYLHISTRVSYNFSSNLGLGTCK